MISKYLKFNKTNYISILKIITRWLSNLRISLIY